MYFYKKNNYYKKQIHVYPQFKITKIKWQFGFSFFTKLSGFSKQVCWAKFLSLLHWLFQSMERRFALELVGRSIGRNLLTPFYSHKLLLVAVPVKRQYRKFKMIFFSFRQSGIEFFGLRRLCMSYKDIVGQHPTSTVNESWEYMGTHNPKFIVIEMRSNKHTCLPMINKLL